MTHFFCSQNAFFHFSFATYYHYISFLFGFQHSKPIFIIHICIIVLKKFFVLYIMTHFHIIGLRSSTPFLRRSTPFLRRFFEFKNSLSKRISARTRVVNNDSYILLVIVNPMGICI